MNYAANYPIPQNMRDTINNCTVGLGVTGIWGGAAGPGSDLVVIAPTWATMMATLAKQAGRQLDGETAKRLAVAAATGIAAFIGGTKIAAQGAGWLFAIPSAGLSILLAMAGNAALNAKFTHAFGKACARYFLQSRDFEGIDVVTRVLVAFTFAELGLRRPDHGVLV